MRWVRAWSRAALSRKCVWFCTARISQACATELRPRRTAANTRQSRDKFRREKVRPKAALAS